MTELATNQLQTLRKRFRQDGFDKNFNIVSARLDRARIRKCFDREYFQRVWNVGSRLDITALKVLSFFYSTYKQVFLAAIHSPSRFVQHITLQIEEAEGHKILLFFFPER